MVNENAATDAQTDSTYDELKKIRVETGRTQDKWFQKLNLIDSSADMRKHSFQLGIALKHRFLRSFSLTRRGNCLSSQSGFAYRRVPSVSCAVLTHLLENASRDCPKLNSHSLCS
ncbi:hypothetical protein NPIL_673631 [Nephila pilipes]|uniref:Uncharacterized protein n=1 Tax=Nephila pilipes TaxID=299642 RepID=A0A8X6MZN8_NEPPI|nr:hypothetical protein NPIL_673631 [Nephila pilipes]